MSGTRFSAPWVSQRIGDIAAVDPETLTSATDPDYTFHYISLDDVDTGRIRTYAEVRFADSPARARRVLRSGDVMLATVRPNLQSHFWYRGQPPQAVCSTGFAVLRPKPERCASGFVFAHLFGDVVGNQIHRTIAGSNYPAITSRDVRRFEIPCPPTMIEQQEIAEALSDVDGLLDSLEALIAKKRAVKHAAMQQLLTGRTRLPGFGQDWQTRRIRDLLVYERPDRYILLSDVLMDSGGIPVLTGNKAFVLGYTDEQVGVCRHLPTIVFDDFTTACQYATRPFKVRSSAIKLLRPRAATVNLRYMFERMRLIRFSSGDHKRYYVSEYQALEVLIPSYEEQVAIDSVLSDMDAEIEALERRLAKTRAIKLGMMEQLLTGRIRLTGSGERNGT